MQHAIDLYDTCCNYVDTMIRNGDYSRYSSYNYIYCPATWGSSFYKVKRYYDPLTTDVYYYAQQNRMKGFNATRNRSI